MAPWLKVKGWLAQIKGTGGFVNWGELLHGVMDGL
jgi:hypothetical protein